MGVVDDFLKKMKMVSDDEYDDDDFDDYDDFDDDEEDEIYTPPKKKNNNKKAKRRAAAPEPDEDEDLYQEPEEAETPYSASGKSQRRNNNVVGLRTSQPRSAVPEVCMIMPKSFDDANTIADVLLSHRAVVLNLEGIDMAAAQRIIDFASGSCYTVGGSLQKISRKIFIVVPSDMTLSGDFEEMVGDMIDLNAVNMMR